MGERRAARFELFPADELGPGEMRAVVVDGRSVALVRTQAGDLHALRDVCPHQGAPLSRGYVDVAVRSDGVGRYLESGQYAVRCPWHGHEFAVETGRCLADPERIRVRAYPVGVEDGTIVIWC